MKIVYYKKTGNYNIAGRYCDIEIDWIDDIGEEDFEFGSVVVYPIKGNWVETEFGDYNIVTNLKECEDFYLNEDGTMFSIIK